MTIPSLRAVVVLSVATIGLPSLAQAEYRYEYHGNAVTVTSVSGFDPITTVHDAPVNLVAYTPSLLTTGATLADVTRFSMSGDTWDIADPLIHPYPPPAVSFPDDPNACEGCVGNPYNIATFQIGAVNASGLPTAWNIGIDFSYTAPTGREFVNRYATSTQLDSISGGYYIFSFAGSLANSPGVWTVSAVPEPATPVMFLLGTVTLVFVARRKRKLDASRSLKVSRRTSLGVATTSHRCP